MECVADSGMELDPILTDAPTGTDYGRIVGGDNFACALRESGGIYCWGSDEAVPLLLATATLDEGALEVD